MSEISISVAGGGSLSIDSETMRKRLEAIRNNLQTAIDNGAPNAERLQDRLNKVNGQLDRLTRFEGKDVEVSAEYAARQLDLGLKYLQEGQNALGELAGYGINSSAGAKLESWASRLGFLRGHVDQVG